MLETTAFGGWKAKEGIEWLHGIGRLVAAGLLFRQGLPPHATYLFKHALVRDVAYGSRLRDQRQQLHGRIADVLAEHFPMTVEADRIRDIKGILRVRSPIEHYLSADHDAAIELVIETELAAPDERAACRAGKRAAR